MPPDCEVFKVKLTNKGDAADLRWLHYALLAGGVRKGSRLCVMMPSNAAHGGALSVALLNAADGRENVGECCCDWRFWGFISISMYFVSF